MSGERILVVDDNDANRRLAEAILAPAGYRVELAESGARAIEVFRASPPSVVLLDVLMPEMDGFETLGRLRSLEGGASAAIMIVTALNDLATVQRAIALGADDFIAKPLQRTELLVRIWSLLASRPTTDEPRGESAPPAPARRAEERSARDELTALLVHDLKHPLTTIYFTAGLLRRDGALSPKAQAKVSRILRASETLEGMILSILDVTQSEDGSLKLEATEFPVSALLDDVVASMEPLAEQNRQTIEVSNSLEDRRITADRDLLRRALENLIDNSTKYAPPDTTIRIETRAPDGSVEFRVQDEGPGIPHDHREDVFRKYFRLRREGECARRARKGRGLGLVLVRVAAEAHGGSAWVEESPGGGSCFCVRVASPV
ncbi:hybrid sensor histidine kinase/response regulator [bacterium]|nr:hybrid sensor histidine kinase/response regulator [bacterium]